MDRGKAGSRGVGRGNPDASGGGGAKRSAAWGWGAGVGEPGRRPVGAFRMEAAGGTPERSANASNKTGAGPAERRAHIRPTPRPIHRETKDPTTPQ